jgi:hypothetical protein
MIIGAHRHNALLPEHPPELRNHDLAHWIAEAEAEEIERQRFALNVVANGMKYLSYRNFAMNCGAGYAPDDRRTYQHRIREQTIKNIAPLLTLINDHIKSDDAELRNAALRAAFDLWFAREPIPSSSITAEMLLDSAADAYGRFDPEMDDLSQRVVITVLDSLPDPLANSVNVPEVAPVVTAVLDHPQLWIDAVPILNRLGPAAGPDALMKLRTRKEHGGPDGYYDQAIDAAIQSVSGS